MVKRWAIFDLDNTIADINDRLAVASANGKLDYSKLHDPELIKTDKPMYETIDLMNDLANFNVNIFILTARFVSTKQVTEQWLHDYNVPYDKLVMKEYKDTYVRSDKWKERELHKFNNFNNIILSCDDYIKNQAMFESYDIPCLDPIITN
tara:strand:+ start:116 stop:565 length:450 start_codon:yes stop_codon:yes gene_type:complete